MLEAQLKGKLSSTDENMEDLLTSNVFGVLTYTHPEKGLAQYLRLSSNETGMHELPAVVGATYDFWPRWKEEGCYFCEPDLAITLSPVLDSKMPLECQ